MIAPTDYGINKPTFRQHQFETAVQTVAAFQSGAKVVGVNAPCGFGKTLYCVTVAKMLGSHHFTFVRRTHYKRNS